MLAADKLQLESHLKQQAVSLKEKEFNLHVNNFLTVGTQAAVLAGLDVTLLIEFQPNDLSTWQQHHQIYARMLLLLYYGMITWAFCCNVRVVSQTTVLSVLGAGLALRGPDGSMVTATDTLYAERLSIFTIFGYGLALTLAAVVVGVWLILQVEAAAVSCVICTYSCFQLYKHYARVAATLAYNEHDSVDVRDLLNGLTSSPTSALNANNNSRGGGGGAGNSRRNNQNRKNSNAGRHQDVNSNSRHRNRNTPVSGRYTNNKEDNLSSDDGTNYYYSDSPMMMNTTASASNNTTRRTNGIHHPTNNTSPTNVRQRRNMGQYDSFQSNTANSDHDYDIEQQMSESQRSFRRRYDDNDSSPESSTSRIQTI